MAQLPPPSLLLGRRQGGSIVRGKRGAPPGSPTISGQIHRLEADSGPRSSSRRRGRKPGAHGSRPCRVPLRPDRGSFHWGGNSSIPSRDAAERKTAAVGPSACRRVLPPSLVRRFSRARLAAEPRHPDCLSRRTSRLRSFIAEFGLHRVDVVIADWTPPGAASDPGVQPPSRRVAARLSFAGRKARRLDRRQVPALLHGTPGFFFLARASAVRRALEPVVRLH